MPSPQSWLQLAAYLLILGLLVWPLGTWLTAVADGRLPRWLKPVTAAEHALYRLAGVDPVETASWKRYAVATVAFNLLGLVVYALQRLQGVLPLNPQSFGAVSPDSSFNTAFSFVGNTNWQGYSGESTMSYLTQMLALTVQVTLGDVEIDRVARIVRKGGVEVHLTPIEYRLLGVLVANARRVLTHRHLLREVWGPSHVEHNHYLRVFMGTLRHKLEDDPAQPKMLVTETGVGYRLIAG